MQTNSINQREIRGREIAEKCRIEKQGNVWLVPSQSKSTKYKVNLQAEKCSCPDNELRRKRCKHLYAVEYTIDREFLAAIDETPAKVEVVKPRNVKPKLEKIPKPTYRQEWASYNAAQQNEKAHFQSLLSELCNPIADIGQKNGRPRLPLADMIFSATYKVYSLFSGRRYSTDMREAHIKQYISKCPHYNSIFNYLKMEMLTPYLLWLIEESSLPLASIEKDFAVDSTGFSTCRYTRWISAKYEDETLIERKDWVKLHFVCGVKTNIVTAALISDRYENDSPFFEPLLDATAKNFQIRQISADKAYLADANFRAALKHKAMPFIPFKSNSKPVQINNESKVWTRLYHYFALNQDKFLENYHKRSNAESTVMMIKAKFGDALKSKTTRAQINESLCKVLCHNLCCLIQSMYEFGIEPKFY